MHSAIASRLDDRSQEPIEHFQPKSDPRFYADGLRLGQLVLLLRLLPKQQAGTMGRSPPAAGCGRLLVRKVFSVRLHNRGRSRRIVSPVPLTRPARRSRSSSTDWTLPKDDAAAAWNCASGCVAASGTWTNGLIETTLVPVSTKGDGMRAMLALMIGLCVVLGAVAVRPAAGQPGAPQGAAVNDKEVVRAAQFAVKSQQQAMQTASATEKLTLVKIVSAQTQVVAGINYHLTLQVKVGSQIRAANATVWEQAWLNKIELTSWTFTDEGGAGKFPASARQGHRRPAEQPQPAGGKAGSATAPAARGKSLKFTVYAGTSLFVKNTFEPKEEESFAVLKTMEAFDGVFGVGMVMGGKQPEINAQTFKSQNVVVVVKRGPMCTYKVASVKAKGDGLEVRYTVKADPPGSASYDVPLIVGVPQAAVLPSDVHRERQGGQGAEVAGRP